MAQAFVLAIWVTLKPGMVDKWLEAWKPVAEHVRLHEPDTLAYEVSVAEDNPDRLFIYERCVTPHPLACCPLVHHTDDTHYAATAYRDSSGCHGPLRGAQHYSAQPPPSEAAGS